MLTTGKAPMDESGGCRLSVAWRKLMVKRLRYTTSHPRDVDDELIEAHRDLDKPYLHLRCSPAPTASWPP